MNNRRSTSQVTASALFKVGLSVRRAGPWAKSPSGPTEPPARHRFPADVIRHAVWLYFRFSLSFPDVEELMAARSVDVSYETIRQWTIKFGSRLPENRRCRRPLWVVPRHLTHAGKQTLDSRAGSRRCRGLFGVGFGRWESGAWKPQPRRGHCPQSQCSWAYPAVKVKAVQPPDQPRPVVRGLDPSHPSSDLVNPRTPSVDLTGEQHKTVNRALDAP